MRLILVRHGETPSNVAGALDTARPGAPLTALGHRQAAAISDALTGLGIDRIVAVHASPLVRTQLTGTPLATARGLDVVVEEGLEEIEAGDLEMLTDDASVTAYNGTVDAWTTGRLDVAMPGGRDGHAFLSRFDGAVGRLTADHADDATVVAVSHGAAIRAFSARYGAPEGARLRNTGAAILDGSPSAGWAVTRWSFDPLGGTHLVDVGIADPTGD